MIDDISDIADYYDGNVDREDRRLSMQRLERDLTRRFFEKWLPESGDVLELGAATGRHSIWLAERGLNVTAVDLSAALIAEARKRERESEASGRFSAVVGDARDLANFGDESFNAVLVLGPLYHLVREGDRSRVLSESFRVLRDGGVIMTAHLSRIGVLSDLIRRSPEWIADEGEVRSLLARGQRADESQRGGFRGYFCEVDELEPLHRECGFEMVELAGVEPVIGALDEGYNGLDDVLREKWLDVLFEVSTNQRSIASSRHLLYVGRKTIAGGVS